MTAGREDAHADSEECPIQVADAPGRCEPGTGEINYPGVARALNEMGFRGPVAMEAFASGDPEAALDAFRRTFTI